VNGTQIRARGMKSLRTVSEFCHASHPRQDVYVYVHVYAQCAILIRVLFASMEIRICHGDQVSLR
jgi:hypothetical protein